MPKKNRKQATIIDYPQDITINPEDELQETVTDTPETPVEDQPTETQAQDQILEITWSKEKGEQSETEESPSEEAQTEDVEAPAEDQASESAESHDEAPQPESTGDVYTDNWRAMIVDIEQQPRMRRGYTERAIRLYPAQVAIVEDVATFRHATPNKVIQRALNDGVDHRYSLIASSILSDPLLQDTISPADIDAVMFGFLDGQISRLRAKAQDTVNPADRASEWQRVGQLEMIRDHFKRHPNWAE